MNRNFFNFMFFMLILMSACRQTPTKQSEKDMLSHVPEWSKETVWYQIFVERFRNGDPSNDPKPIDLYGTYPDTVPADWNITPWNHDWYQTEPWFAHTGLKDKWNNLQLRRYGGDLQGVLDKLDYLSQLGIRAIYFNPLNDAPSLHKYDPRYWHHIDRNFGPNPQKDAQTMKTENHDNPQQWQWTEADKLFLKVIAECHKRNIRVVLDYSFNHTGREFWAFKDVRENGINSRYADWYQIDTFDIPETARNEFYCKGWAGIAALPEMKKDIIGQKIEMPFEGNLHSAEAKQHIFSVARRWIDPNGDGKFDDGVDGYRLDVAGEVPMDFWREFRKEVRKINPDFYIVGEIWWQKWPNTLLDPIPFLQGDMFDAVMNYRWFQESYNFFANQKNLSTPSQFAKGLQMVTHNIDTAQLEGMMNLVASHDAPRISTTLYNKSRYKFREKPTEDPAYKIDKPDEGTIKIQKMVLIHQFTFIGSPHIYYGDEAGMWGADDPDCRKPMVWSDIVYDNETHHPLNAARKTDEVKPDTSLLSFYKKLIRLRTENPIFAFGNFKILIADDLKDVFVYSRDYQNKKAIVCFNHSKITQSIVIENVLKSKFRDIFSGKIIKSENNKISISLPSEEAFVLLSE